MRGATVMQSFIPFPFLGCPAYSSPAFWTLPDDALSVALDVPIIKPFPGAFFDGFFVCPSFVAIEAFHAFPKQIEHCSFSFHRVEQDG